MMIMYKYGRILGMTLLLTLLLAAVNSSIMAFAQTQGKPKIVVWLKGAMGADLHYQAAVNDLTQYEWYNVTGELTSTDLVNASALIVIMVDSTMNVTEDELNVIKNWLSEGHKLIWVAGDADYGTDRFRQTTANYLLEGIGSKLRVDICEVTDTKSNAGKVYRVLGLSDKCDEEVKFLVAGVNRALFHGPAPIIAYVNGEYVRLNEKKIENVYRVMWTSDEGTIEEFNEPFSYVYELNEQGRFVVLAVELDPVNRNLIVVSGDGPFDHYTGMYKPELRKPDRYGVEYPQQGATLLANILSWGISIDEFIKQASLPGEISNLQNQVNSLQSEVEDIKGQLSQAQSMQPIYLIGGLIVGLIIGFAVAKYIIK